MKAVPTRVNPALQLWRGNACRSGARPPFGGPMSGKDKEREDRLAAALRENLRRRKAQSREMGEKEEKPES